jgi:AraC family ethanolamine operon transcriptional activator
MDTPFFIHQKFTDFDELCCNMQHWNLDYSQLEAGRFTSELLMFGNNTIIIGREILGRRIRQTGASPTSLITLGILVNPKTHIHWRGYDMFGDMLCIFPQGGELESITYDDFDVFPVSISEETLNQACELLELPYITALIGNSEVFRCNPHKLAELRSWLLSVTHELITGTAEIRNIRFLKQIEQGLADRLVRILAEHHEPVRIKSLRKRDKARLAAENYIAEAGSEQITVSELCSAVNVSERTLEYAFRERYNLTPKSYTLMHRMNNVRKQLRKANTDQGTVLEIARQHDFWHMGQFGADYKKIFAELPSETLKTSKLGVKRTFKLSMSTI